MFYFDSLIVVNGIPANDELEYLETVSLKSNNQYIILEHLLEISNLKALTIGKS